MKAPGFGGCTRTGAPKPKSRACNESDLEPSAVRRTTGSNVNASAPTRATGNAMRAVFRTLQGERPAACAGCGYSGTSQTAASGGSVKSAENG